MLRGQLETGRVRALTQFHGHAGTVRFTSRLEHAALVKLPVKRWFDPGGQSADSHVNVASNVPDGESPSLAKPLTVTVPLALAKLLPGPHVE